MVFLGIDLHKRYSTITAMDKEGKTIKQGNVPNCEHELLSFLASIEEDKKAVVEATTNWSCLCDLLEGGGVEVVLSHPLKTRAIASARIKTDKLDSKTLADLLRGDLVAPAWLAPYEVRQTRDLIRLRACLVKDQTAVKNRIHALLIKNNVDHPSPDLFG